VTKAAGEEKYLGGFSSATMRREVAAGYGIYATNRRFFGIYDRLASPGPLLARRPSGHQLMKLLAKSGEKALISELERRRDLEVKREDISTVEIRKPGLLRKGRIMIRDVSGRRADLWILEDRDFEQAKNLLQKFRPDALIVT